MDTTQYFPIAGVLTAWMVLAIGVYVLLLAQTKWKLPGKDMVGRKKDAVTVIGAALVVFALLGGAWNEIMPPSGGGGGGGGTPPVQQISQTGCPSTGLTSVTFDVQNNINDATLEEYDVGMTCVGSGNSVSITDTTDANGSNFVCGAQYTCYITSTASANGDGSYVQGILSGTGTVSNGQLVFTATGAAQSFQLKVDQIGVVEARMKDVINDGLMYDTGVDNSAIDYETDGTTFSSTTNGTATNVSTSGRVHVQLEFESTVIDNSLNDGRGLLFAIDAPVTEYGEPTILLDSASMSDCKSALDASEKLALNGYEYVYCYTGAKKFEKGSGGTFDMDISALSGVDPSTDIQIDIIPRGQKVSTLDATKFVQSAYDDSASHTVILQVDDFAIDIV